MSWSSSKPTPSSFFKRACDLGIVDAPKPLRQLLEITLVVWEDRREVPQEA
jgi:hypothetical protein